MDTTAITTTLTALRKEHSEMLSPLDVPLSWTGRQLDAYETRRSLLANRISTLGASAGILSRVEPQLDALKVYRDVLVACKATIETELLAVQQARTEEELGRKTNLEMSLQALDGTGYLRKHIDHTDYGWTFEQTKLARLLSEHGTSYQGTLKATLESITSLQAEYDDNMHRLNDALMSDDEREQKAKDDKIARDARAAQGQLKTRGDGTRYYKRPDGTIVDASTNATV